MEFLGIRTSAQLTTLTECYRLLGVNPPIDHELGDIKSRMDADEEEAAVGPVVTTDQYRVSNMGYMGHFLHSLCYNDFSSRAVNSKNDPHNPYGFALMITNSIPLHARVSLYRLPSGSC